jgi:CTP synthase
LGGSESDLTDWREWVERLRNPSGQVDVAIVGKYVELPDAYLSVKESLIHAGVANGVGVNIRWLHSQEMESAGVEEALAGVDGVIVPGGFGERGFEGKVRAARYARENQVPYLGLCLGLHTMVVEFARKVFNSDEPNSTEFHPESAYPVISLLSEQQGVQEKGGTMRLGGYPCRLVPGTKAYAAYGRDEVIERHRHRYEFNNEYRAQLEEAGLIASGTLPDGSLVEICELRDHPWMVGSQFHPELRSRPNRPHPLFNGFVAAAAERTRGRGHTGRGAAAAAGAGRRTARSPSARA